MIRDLVAFAVGCLATGVLAHRKPEWFNKAVASVNTIDDKVNAAVKQALAKTQATVTPPQTPPAA